MPVTFRYVATETPPAPFALVSVGRPDGTTRATDLPVKVDSGADRTVIPASLATELRLDEVERRQFEGLGGHRITMALVRVLLAIRSCPEVEVSAAANDGEPYILLGRDVLNNFRVVLDGPSGKMEIG